jgi:hypothetical protein
MSDDKRASIRRGKSTLRENRALKRIREAAGTAELQAVIEKAEGEGSAVVAKNVNQFFEHKQEGRKPWDTEGKGLGPEGRLLTLEDLIFLKPFAMEDLSSTVAFRVDDKVMRAFQRVKESSGGVFDILSDLYREAAVIGLLVLSERHKSILGLEVVISQAKNHQRLKEEAADTALRLKEALRPLSPEMRKIYFHNFMLAMEERPQWIQETYLEEMRDDMMLSELLDGLREPE